MNECRCWKMYLDLLWKNQCPLDTTGGGTEPLAEHESSKVVSKNGSLPDAHPGNPKF